MKRRSLIKIFYFKVLATSLWPSTGTYEIMNNLPSKATQTGGRKLEVKYFDQRTRFHYSLMSYLIYVTDKCDNLKKKFHFE